jgi:hypothetical protein
VPTYSWLTQTEAQNALLARLSAGSFWSNAELQIYLFEGLRHWNGLTEQWNQPYVIPNAQGQWINLGTLSGSPRLRSVTDQFLYGQMCYLLLEPQLSSGVWAGTVQFTLQNLQASLQKRCNETIQATSCNIAQLASINSTPGVRTGYVLGDTVLEARRNRFLALMATTTGTGSSGASTIVLGSATGIAAGQVITGTGIKVGTFITSISGTTASLSLPTSGVVSGNVQCFQPFLLTREDVLAFQSFEPGYLQQYGFPQSWTVVSQSPLTFDVDVAPTTPGLFDMLALNAAPTFAPPTPSLLGLPDDWSMVPMYGAMADVLGTEAESTDRRKAEFYRQRYADLTGLMQGSNWVLQTLINGQVSSLTSLSDMDALAVNWQESQAYLPAVVEAGMDMMAPIPGQGQSLSVTVVANAPLLDNTNTYVQCARDDWPAILNYAHYLAMMKTVQWQETLPLLKSFYQQAAARNKRWENYGCFVRYLKEEGLKQEMASPRA